MNGTDVFMCWLLVAVIQSVFTLWIVPYSHRKHYTQYKSKTNRLAVILYHSIWGGAIIYPVEIFSISFAFIGALMWITGCVLVVWARAVNPYFLPELIVPDYIVTTGPYFWLKHPGYVGFLFMAGGAFVAIGSIWSVPFAILYALLILDRINKENEFLKRNIVCSDF